MAHRKVEEEVERLNRLRTAPPGEAAEALRAALTDRVNLVVAKAAALAAELRFYELVPDLLRAFDRLFERPAERDPQCWGKNALAKALVELDHRESPPFVRGLRHIQMEPVWGGKEDTASTLRGTCLLAAVACTDLRRGEMLRYLVDALAETAATVRIEAVRALEQMEGDEAVLLLRLKARLGDSELRVTGQVFDALARLEGAGALPFLEGFLNNLDEAIREEAALTLGSSRFPAAVELLRERWQKTRDSGFRCVLLRAISASRQPEAIAFLLDLLKDGRVTDAQDALEALALHRASADIVRQVEDAVHNGDGGHAEAFQRLFQS